MQKNTNTIVHMGNSLKIRFFAGIIALTTLISCGINIVKAIQYSPITVANTTGNIEVIDNQFNNLTISPELVFNSIGDSITYEVPLSNPNNTKYQIDSISDDNINQYITTSYSYDKSLNADNKSIYITLTYTNELPQNETLQVNDIHTSIQITELEEQPTNPDDSGSTTNPGGSGDTTNPDDSGSTTNPGESGDTTNPDDSGSTTNPGGSGDTTNPDNSGSTTEPGNSGSTTEPGNSGSITNPDDSGSTTNPGGSGDTTNPDNSEGITEPSDSESTTKLDKLKESKPEQPITTKETNTTITPHRVNEISTPNTGKYFNDYSTSTLKNILPPVILGILSIIILIEIIVPKKHRIKFGIPVIVISFSFASALIQPNTYANTSNHELTIVGSKISIAQAENTTPTDDTANDLVSFYFPNIYNNPNLMDVDQDDISTYKSGNAIIMKTFDNKYVLLDTGEMDEEGTRAAKTVIYNKLKELQQNSNVILDYLIISHLDGDHYGNAVGLLNDSNVTIRNVILKYERYTGAHSAWMDNTRLETFTKIVTAAANNHTNIITNADASDVIAETGATDFDTITEGMTIQIGDHLKLDFFNTTNVYAGKDCKNAQQVLWKATRDPDLPFKTSTGKYVYFEGSNPDQLIVTDQFSQETGSGINRRFYAVDKTNEIDPTTGENEIAKGNICRSNPNSLGILAEVKLDEDNTRYAYFANDLENAGYDIGKGGGNTARIFENLDFNNGDFTTDVTPYTIPSEDKIAIKVRNKIGDDSLNNIDIYQISHHGYNNSKDAVDTLGLNRESGIFAIEEGFTDMSIANNWALIKSYYITLSNIPAERKMKVGTADKSGVQCNMNTQHGTTCEFY